MNTLPLHIEPLKNGGCISWLIADPNSREALLVDPKLEDMDRYKQVLSGYNYKLVAIFDTHGHADHVTAAPALVEALGAPLYRHYHATAPCATKHLKDGDTISLGDIKLVAKEAFGHTMDHMVLHGPGVVFTGDTLLLKTCGRTDFPGGDSKLQWQTLQTLAKLPDATMVCPGHDYRGLTHMSMGEVKAVNERLALKSEEEFVQVMANLNLDLPEKIQESLAAAKFCTWKEYAADQGITVGA